VPKEVLRDVEDMLQRDLMLNYATSAETNSFEHMAEIFNRTDSERCDALLAHLGSKHPEAVMKIKQLMFTFDDLLNIDPKSLQTVIRACDSDTLMYALKGCSPEHRDKIISNLSERAKVIVLDNMETLGPVLMRDVDAAKASILRKAKELAETNTIVIARGQASAMVY
jgi:flagellar motor switch protein FliG